MIYCDECGEYLEKNYYISYVLGDTRILCKKCYEDSIFGP